MKADKPMTPVKAWACVSSGGALWWDCGTQQPVIAEDEMLPLSRCGPGDRVIRVLITELPPRKQVTR